MLVHLQCFLHKSSTTNQKKSQKQYSQDFSDSFFLLKIEEDPFRKLKMFISESLGQKVGRLSGWASPSPSKQETAAAAVKLDEAANEAKDVKSSTPPTKKPEDSRRMRSLRFAPELDGVNCFETILPY